MKEKGSKPQTPLMQRLNKAYAKQQSIKAFQDYQLKQLEENPKMQQGFVILSSELAALKESVDGDFASKVYGNWPTYVKRFNDLSRKVYEFRIVDEPLEIKDVPAGGLSSLFGVGGGTNEEKAKFKEISSSTSMLLSRMQHYQRVPLNAGIEKDDEVTALDPVVSVERICKRISPVIRQLRERHDERLTLDVGDEYDLQDLLHALLHLFFDDVRPEEYTPSYAGKATRMDFLLKNESIVIEAKMTRKGLGAKEVGEHLIIDIAHYKKHPSCKTLFCLVYDPEHRIKNPRGIETDLESMDAELMVKVFIVPTGI